MTAQLTVLRPAADGQEVLQRVRLPILCPYYRTSNDAIDPTPNDIVVPLCTALPVIAPISRSREHAFCGTTAHSHCPHFVAAAAEREATPSRPASQSGARRLALQVIDSLVWVVTIVGGLLIVVLLAMLLTD